MGNGHTKIFAPHEIISDTELFDKRWNISSVERGMLGEWGLIAYVALRTLKDGNIVAIDISELHYRDWGKYGERFYSLENVTDCERAHPDIIRANQILYDTEPYALVPYCWERPETKWGERDLAYIASTRPPHNAAAPVPPAQPETVGTRQEEAAPVPTQDEHAYPQPAATGMQTEEQATPQGEEYAATPQAQWEAALKHAENTSPKEYQQLNAYYMRNWKGQSWNEVELFLDKSNQTARTYAAIGEALAKERGLPLPKK